MSSIIVAEDEARISSFVDKGLRAAGYTTVVAETGAHALDCALSGHHDLMLLDIGLPGLDGFEVLGRVRKADNSLPVIMLTARTAVRDTVAALDGGAVDYLAKPFKFEELLARIRLRLRQAGPSDDAVLTHGGLSLDIHTRRATLDGQTFDLSAREFALAAEFLRHPEQVLSREQLLNRVWNLDFDPGSNVVDVYVRYLRTKFGSERIETVRGIGYRLR